ncbi:MAG: hypothetical protein ABSH30_03855 [Acidimicrobiales bacterium]
MLGRSGWGVARVLGTESGGRSDGLLGTESGGRSDGLLGTESGGRSDGLLGTESGGRSNRVLGGESGGRSECGGCSDGVLVGGSSTRGGRRRTTGPCSADRIAGEHRAGGPERRLCIC